MGTALLGVGMASIFATGFLWVERRMKVTARIGSAFLVASSSGADVFPLVVGQLVEEHPMGFVDSNCLLKKSLLKVHLPHHGDLGRLPLHFYDGQPHCSQGGEEQVEFGQKR